MQTNSLPLFNATDCLDALSHQGLWVKFNRAFVFWKKLCYVYI